MKDWVEIALDYVGTPASAYTGPDGEGFDCSGFVRHVLREAGLGIETPRHANEMFDHLGILVHEGLQRTGDLVFMSHSGLKPNHVGFYIHRKDMIYRGFDEKQLVDNDHYMIESPGSHGTFIEICPVMYSAIEQHPQFPFEPMFYNKNPIGYKRLAVPDGRHQRPLDHSEY